MAIKEREKDCPAGTQFYVCSINNFNGCCSIDPCAILTGCPDSAPQTSSFTPALSSPLASASSVQTERIGVGTITTSSQIPASTPAAAAAATQAAPAATQAAATTHGPTASVLGLSIAIGAIGILMLLLLGWIFRKACLRLFHYQRSTEDIRIHPLHSTPSLAVFELEGVGIAADGRHKDGHVQ